jgi:hypothetical protein
MENKLGIKNWNEYVFDKADLAISDEANKSISRTECRLLRGEVFA